MSVDERISALTAKMLRRKLYVVLSRPSPTPEKLKAHLPAHLEYMIELEKRGVLFASGPLADGAGPPSGAGLTILRAANAGEARALAEADPFVINGLRSYELKEWTVMEGAFGLRVNLSDQSVEIA
ncbi:MAG TPA: YciI family protein [Xanthobacteraceae bacterium]|nr:YciI family protein [Xanthobacteraceae bacterium]